LSVVFSRERQAVCENALSVSVDTEMKNRPINFSVSAYAV